MAAHRFEYQATVPSQYGKVDSEHAPIWYRLAADSLPYVATQWTIRFRCSQCGLYADTVTDTYSLGGQAPVVDSTCDQIEVQKIMES